MALKGKGSDDMASWITEFVLKLALREPAGDVCLFNQNLLIQSKNLKIDE